jgi:hypothetical protein
MVDVESGKSFRHRKLGKAILVRNCEYDLMAEHATAPNAVEARAMQTKEVVLLRQLPELNTALQMLQV